uniref:RHS repeat domain-containing protein n=1 Tax=Butyricimonas virosa TaxID=544645 RepID=UPI00402880EB
MYSDGNSYHSFSPYYETYLPNIQPRTSVKIPPQVYNIKYGGKTLLKERSVYRFETQVTDSATISDFSKATGTPYQKTEFFYDNLKESSYPTRVVQTDARGGTRTVVTKRVTEMEDAASPVFAEMKRKNILAPVVKEIHLKGDTIQVEKVSLYESVEVENVYYSGVSRKYAFYPTSTQTLALSVLPSLDAGLFTQGSSCYLLEQAIDYEQSDRLYLPVGVRSNAGDEALCYDFNNGQVILKANHATSRMVAAADLKKYGEEYSLRNKVSRMLGVYGLSSELYDVCQGIDLSQQTSEFRQYYWSPGHRMMLDLIGGLASKKSMTVEEYNVLIDSVQANRGRHVNDFRSKYMQLPREYLELTNLPELLYNMYYLVERDIIRDPDFFKYRDLVGQEEYLNYTGTIKITVIPESKRLRLFVLNDGRVGSVYYNVVHAGGSSSSSVRLTATPGYSVQSFEIDLSPYENVTSVTVSKPYENVQYVALLPADVSFEAISYNLDGSVFCKFDQNGRAELNEYDAAGRLIRVVDERGNVVRDYQYNVLKLN